jgi:hypothetical protein
VILVANPEQSQAALDEWLILINDQMIVAVNQKSRFLANIYGFDRLNINSTCAVGTLDFQEPFATFD